MINLNYNFPPTHNISSDEEGFKILNPLEQNIGKQ